MSAESLLLTVLVFGIATGSAALGAVIGAGGGFIFVPILILLGFAPQGAVSTSLFMVFFNAVSASIVYYRQGRLELTRVSMLGFLTLPGAVLGAYLLTLIDVTAFRLIFAIVLIGVSLDMILRRSKRRTAPISNEGLGKAESMQHSWRAYPVALAVGFMSSMLGVGGGILMVPSFIHLIGMQTHLATATSLSVTAFSSGFGLTTFTSLGHIAPQLVPAASLAGIVGGLFGAKISRRIKARSIEILAGIALLIVATNMIISP